MYKKYLVKFTVNTGFQGSTREETVDLADYYGEEEAKRIISSDELLNEVYNEWLYENIDGGYQIIGEDNE